MHVTAPKFGASSEKQWLLRVNEYFVRDIIFYSAETLSNCT